MASTHPLFESLDSELEGFSSPSSSQGFMPTPPRTLALGSLVFLGIIIGFGFAWKHWQQVVINDARFDLANVVIQVSPQPEWVCANVVDDILTGGSLSDINLLDASVSAKIARSFELHPWVTEVLRVRKFANGELHVEILYRKPVAMVRARGGGFWPVDKEAVLLPPADFSAEQTRHYVKISVGDAHPAGLEGTPFNDDRVAGAIEIANLFGSTWASLGIAQIEWLESSASTAQGHPQYQLSTKNGTLIHWGAAPGNETTGEERALKKLERLNRLVEDRRILESTESKIIDLSSKTNDAAEPTRTTRRFEN